MQTLPHPIRAEKWKRITFFYTTGQYLLEVQTVNDLVVNSDERKLLWQSLRERVAQGHSYEVPDVDNNLIDWLPCWGSRKCQKNLMLNHNFNIHHLRIKGKKTFSIRREPNIHQTLNPGMRNVARYQYRIECWMEPRD